MAPAHRRIHQPEESQRGGVSGGGAGPRQRGHRRKDGRRARDGNQRHPPSRRVEGQLRPAAGTRLSSPRGVLLDGGGGRGGRGRRGIHSRSLGRLRVLRVVGRPHAPRALLGRSVCRAAGQQVRPQPRLLERALGRRRAPQCVDEELGDEHRREPVSPRVQHVEGPEVVGAGVAVARAARVLSRLARRAVPKQRGGGHVPVSVEHRRQDLRVGADRPRAVRCVPLLPRADRGHGGGDAEPASREEEGGAHVVPAGELEALEQDEETSAQRGATGGGNVQPARPTVESRHPPTEGRRELTRAQE
mmetsp:Transcript_16160/g.52970  ORF Transcript_16160/g.52970 Transcript_16160/m.52970 type:complete len:303 (+) Transcript_16160:1192-2100(+)